MTKRKKKRALSRKRTQQGVIIGVTWYTPEQFTRMKSVAEDADGLDDTYNDWLKNASAHVRRLRKDGYQVVKVPMDVDEWVVWCQQHGKTLTGPSRSQYTSHKASTGSGLSSPPGQFVSRYIKPRPNPIPFLDKLEIFFEAERDKSIPPPYPFDEDRNLIHLPKEVEDHLRLLAHTGKKIEAVKQVTRLTGAGLRVAKDYVDGLVG